MKKLALIHTSATLVPVFAELCKEWLPGIDTFNIVDDSLIKNTIARGELTSDTSRRVVDYAASAEAAGADMILYTCSSIGPAVETAATLTGVPVLRVDQAMADLAVRKGNKIGVIATLPTTLSPTSDLVQQRADAAGKQVEVISRLCEGAFDALMNGDGATHDEIVGNALRQLVHEVDVVVLAQASMARVVTALSPSEKSIPILASPELAIQHIAKLVNEENS